MNEPQFKSYQIPYRLIVVFLLLGIGIGTAGYFYYKDQEAHLRKLNENELSAVAELKVNELFRWRRERIGDAKTVAESPHLISAIRQWFQEPSSENLKKEIYLWMISLRATYDYETVLLLDAEGAVRLSVPEIDENFRTHIRSHVADAIQKKEIVFTDFHKVEPTDRIHISMIIPLLVLTKGGKHFVGTFVLDIDPRHFLYPFIQAWPIPSRTSETLLIRREGNEVAYLNDLRHQKNTALSLRSPLSHASSPAAMAASGIEGVVEGIDYRGTRVLAAIRAIPHSPWFLIAKIDQDEVFEPYP